jgi:hypothetical protein
MISVYHVLFSSGVILGLISLFMRTINYVDPTTYNDNTIMITTILSVLLLLVSTIAIKLSIG